MTTIELSTVHHADARGGRRNDALADPRVRRAVAALSVPRRAVADSFVLHAPLELLARIGLAHHLEGDVREEALKRIAALASAFESSGEPVDPPPPVDAPDLAAGAAALDRALRDGDLESVDAWAAWLGDRADHAALALLLGEAIVDSLAAAGHAPIGLHLLARVASGERWGGLLRQPLRELARRPEWRLSWFRATAPAAHTPLADSIRAVPHLGLPGSNFIHPVMSQIESSGVARDLLVPALGDAVADPVAAGRTLLRAASWSMCCDDEAEAPYGWSHCLTMPQGVLALAGRGVEPRTALAVAATFVAGFRAGDGREAVPPLGDEDAPAIAPRGSIEPATLAAEASLHHDAHLVKYTLACLHAAEDDPAWAHVHLAAAAFLADWWRRHPQA